LGGDVSLFHVLDGALADRSACCRHDAAGYLERITEIAQIVIVETEALKSCGIPCLIGVRRRGGSSGTAR
jgi:hypothetical protein